MDPSSLWVVRWVVNEKGGELKKIEREAMTPNAHLSLSSHPYSSQDSQPHAYTLTPGTGDLSPLTVPIGPTRGAICALAISRSNPPLLATGDAQGKIQVYDLTTGATVTSQWVFHSGRISSLAWSNDGKFAVSGGLDTNVFVWSVDRPGKRVQIKKAHAAGVNGVGFVGENKVVSVGQDATVKVWEVVLP